MIRVIRRYHSVQLDEYTNFENNLKGAAARRYALRARCLARRHNLYLKDLVDVMRASDDPDTRVDVLKQDVLGDRLCNTDDCNTCHHEHPCVRGTALSRMPTTSGSGRTMRPPPEPLQQQRPN